MRPKAGFLKRLKKKIISQAQQEKRERTQINKIKFERIEITADVTEI